MRVDSISDQAESLPAKSFSSRQFVKDAVLKWFQCLQLGSLTLIDGDEHYYFGEQKNTHVNPELISATVVVHHPSFYSEILFGGAVGSGESYMRGNWSSPCLVDAIRVLSKNLKALERLNGKTQIAKKILLRCYQMLTMNSVQGSKKNISAHYDLGNDFFSLFLDPTMMYSAGIWQDESITLEEASIAKLDAICQKLSLTGQDHVVEIGTGWGGFAVYAASEYGCKVTTTTISKQQYDYACAKVNQLNLEDKVTVLMQDYRELEGKYDKLVSIEMIEAVGHKYLPGFFKKCDSLLIDEGVMLIQAITISDQRYHKARKSIDFIQRYIFPGGCLPSNAIFAKHVAQDTNMQLVDLHDITHDYALTLKHWRERFFERLSEVKQQGFNDTFIRMWDFYLCYCEGAFRERAIQTAQFVVEKPQCHYQPKRIR